MHETKLLKLLGISLIVGILGLTGFCKKSNDNNDLALGAGLLVAQQQAEQAAYEAANNTENPQWFCAQVVKNNIPGNSPTYQVTLTPLVAQDCNLNYFDNNALKQRLLATIDGDQSLRANCPNTRSYISNFDFSNFSGGGGSGQGRIIYVDGRSLLDEVRLSTTTYTVVSPNIYKLFYSLTLIKNFFADRQSEPEKTTCQTAVQNKLNSSIPDYNTFCILGISPSSTCSSGQTKVVSAMCAYGDIDTDNDGTADFKACKTLNDLF